MSQPIYRKEALDRLASPEQLDQLMSLTSPRGWIALGALGLLIVMLILWAFLGSVADTVQGEGILVRPAGVVSLQSPVGPGKITKMLVQAGQDVQPGQPLAHLTGLAGGKELPEQSLVSPIAGRVLSVDGHAGDSVDANHALIVLESPDQPLQAVVFVRVQDGYRVKPGMEVRLSPAGEREKQAKFLRGKVVSAARFRASRAAIVSSLHDDDWADKLIREGSVLEVVVELLPRSGSDGATTYREVFSGTPCYAQITVDRHRPIELVVPVPSR